MRITVTAEVEIPRPPNFVRMTDGQSLPISALSADALEELADEWRKALLRRAGEQRLENIVEQRP